MKTLVVSYLPRGERSHTKKLLDAFLETASGQKLEHLDLLADTPDMFLAENLGSYIKRNYLGDSLSEAENAAMAKMDRMTMLSTYDVGLVLGVNAATVRRIIYSNKLPQTYRAPTSGTTRTVV